MGIKTFSFGFSFRRKHASLKDAQNSCMFIIKEICWILKVLDSHFKTSFIKYLIREPHTHTHTHQNVNYVWIVS